MSHTDRRLLGLEHGKIGDRIAVVLNGKQIYKSLYKPTNPRTPKQQMHRAKLAFANKLSKVMAEAVNLGFATVSKKGSAQSPRNVFVKKNWNNGALVWLEREQEQGNTASNEALSGYWGIIPEKLCLADGPLYIAKDMASEVRDGRIYISCPNPGLNDSHAFADDQLMVAVYHPALNTTYLYHGPTRNQCAECNFDLPTDAVSNDPVYVYSWFQATVSHRASGSKIGVRPGQASPSLYLGGFIL